MTLRVIDTETSGLSPEKGAELIQIASIDLKREDDGTISAINPMKTFVRPNRPIPPEVSAVHGIIDADVVNAPAFGEALERFKGATCYIAHNCAFDQRFLAGIEGQWICTMKVARRVFTDAPNHKNQTLRYMLGLIRPFGLEREEISAHDALSDVYVTGAIFTHIIENKLASFKDMIAWTGEPVKMTTWPVGKHRGVPMGKVPPDYLSWVLGSDMDAEIKAAAKAELEARKTKAAA